MKQLQSTKRDLMHMPNIEGVWILFRPIQAEMELRQSGDAVNGTYSNSKVKGTIEGTLTLEEKENILTGKWSDQLGAGDFRVAIESSAPEYDLGLERLFFHGNWRHSTSRDWNGVFEGERIREK